MAGKTELVGKIAANLNLKKVEAETVLKSVFDSLIDLVESDGNVTLKGFGRFYIKTSAARKGRNPQTGAEILIPEKAVFAFKAVK